MVRTTTTTTELLRPLMPQPKARVYRPVEAFGTALERCWAVGGPQGTFRGPTRSRCRRAYGKVHRLPRQAPCLATPLPLPRWPGVVADQPLAVRGQSPPWPLSTRATAGNAEGFPGSRRPHPAADHFFHGLLDTRRGGTGSSVPIWTLRYPNPPSSLDLDHLNALIAGKKRSA